MIPTIFIITENPSPGWLDPPNCIAGEDSGPQLLHFGWTNQPPRCELRAMLGTAIDSNLTWFGPVPLRSKTSKKKWDGYFFEEMENAERTPKKEIS